MGSIEMEEHNITSTSYTSNMLYCFFITEEKGGTHLMVSSFLNLKLENDVTKMACCIGEKGVKTSHSVN
jgi:hypothetical protein